MRVLVTGAAGFIGSHLTERLCGLGHGVRALDNFASGRRENLAGMLDSIELVEADLADPKVCRDAVAGVDAVLHHAAISSVPRSIADPAGTHRTNVEATLRLLEACREAGVKRVVYAASSSVYGDGDQLPKHEALPPRPRSPYAVQKHVGELYGALYTELFGLQVVSLRYFNVFGPRQSPDSEYSAVIPRLIGQMLRGERPTIYGDGRTSRDFVYVTDAVEANLAALAAPAAAGRCINVGRGERVSLNELVEMLNGLLGSRLPALHLPERPGDVRHSQADIRLAEELLGLQPKVAFEEGLRRTLAWLKA
jgi:UDP-glucose 4-epimerase